jgi:hypothetical protein
MSAELDAEMGLPDIFLDHLLAWLDAPSYQSPSLTELAAMQTPRAQIVWYNQRDEPVRLVEEGLTLPAGYRAELIPSPAVSIAAGSQIGALTTGDRVTSDGTSLFPSATAAVKAALAGFHA